MLPSWASQTITIIRPGTRIERGSEIFDWSNPETQTVNGCSVQPTSTSLSQDGRVLGVSEGVTAYLPPGTDIREGDRVEYDGNVYTINGAPKVWKSATGLTSNVQVNLERWSG